MLEAYHARGLTSKSSEAYRIGLTLAFCATQIARECQRGAVKCFCCPGIRVTLRGLCVVSVFMIRHSHHDSDL
jgi:hypothetical protein